MRNTLTLVAATLLMAASAFAAEPPTPTSSTALLPTERTWLTPFQAGAYDRMMTAAAGNSDAIAKAVKDARAFVAHNLPEGARADYAKLTAGPVDNVRINDLLYSLVNLTPSEIAFLAQKKPAALKEYQAAMAKLTAGGALPADKHADAHALVLQYRAMTVTPAAPRRPAAAPARTTKAVVRTPGSTKAHALPLTPRETAWLTDAEAKAYAKALKKPGLKSTERLAILKQYRDLLAGADLPEEFREGYKAKIAESPAAAKIDEFLLTIVELSPEELAALEKITKEKPTAGYKPKNANALADYDEEMTPLPKLAGHVTPQKCHEAYTITAKYRGIAKDAANKATLPGGSTDPAAAMGAPLSDKELAALTPAERTAYEAEKKAAGTDPAALAAVNKKYRNLAATHNIDVFNGLPSDANRKDLCAPYKDYIAGSGTVAGATASECDPTLIDTRKCKQPGKQPDRKCIDELTKACQTAHPQTATPTSTALPPLDEKVKAACAALNAQAPSTVQRNPQQASNSIDNLGPGSHTGTDKGEPEKEKGFFDKMTKEESANIRAGAAGAAFGLLIGSFFGPVGMLVGAAIGGGAFFGANYALNKMP